jgi:hypothetical protein
VQLVSRAQWGARAYRTPAGATSYSRARRGVKLHYLGSAYSDRTHDRCDGYVRQVQAQHMDGNGWSDIGYSFLVCTHGYVYEGRGLRRRNSANGNTTLNEQDYAVCLLVGSSGLTKPTDAQLSGARDAIDYCRSQGPAGTWLGGHRDGYATACPGDAIYAWVKQGAPRPSTTTEEDDVTPEQVEKAVLDVLKSTAGQDALYKGVLKNDKMPAPLTSTTRDTNPTWQLASIETDTNNVVRSMKGTVETQAATIDQLVKAVATLAAGLGDLDPAAIVAELTAAIESIDIRFDVPDAQ